MLCAVFEKLLALLEQSLVRGQKPDEPPGFSEDDLDTLLGTRLSRTALRQGPEVANDLASLLRVNLDPKRFPWVVDGRAPGPYELQAAKLATATATAIQRVHTKRRGDEKKELEAELEAILNVAGFTSTQKPATNISVLSSGPRPGTYMKECNLGADNADFVVGLRNGRFLALEAKASNSEINSRKRLNKEVAQDAQHWARDFGAQVVAAAGLRGVFKPAYVADAQNTPLLIFWGHRLSDLSDYLADKLRLSEVRRGCVRPRARDGHGEARQRLLSPIDTPSPGASHMANGKLERRERHSFLRTNTFDQALQRVERVGKRLYCRHRNPGNDYLSVNLASR